MLFRSDELGKMRLEFKGNKVIPSRGEGKTEDPAEFTLDSKAKPKAIDIKPPKGSEKLVLGIYELDGDTLKICFNEDAKRPKEFASAEGSRTVLLILKREKK